MDAGLELIWGSEAEAGPVVRAGNDSSFSSRRSSFSSRSTTARGRVRRKSSGCGDGNGTGPRVWISGFVGGGTMPASGPGAKPVVGALPPVWKLVVSVGAGGA